MTMTMEEARKRFEAFHRKASRRVRAAELHGFDTDQIRAENEAERESLLAEIQESRTKALRQLLADLQPTEPPTE
jgi:hypothetical protein